MTFSVGGDLWAKGAQRDLLTFGITPTPQVMTGTVGVEAALFPFGFLGLEVAAQQSLTVLTSDGLTAAYHQTRFAATPLVRWLAAISGEQWLSFWVGGGAEYQFLEFGDGLKALAPQDFVFYPVAPVLGYQAVAGFTLYRANLWSTGCSAEYTWFQNHIDTTHAAFGAEALQFSFRVGAYF